MEWPHPAIPSVSLLAPLKRSKRRVARHAWSTARLSEVDAGHRFGGLVADLLEDLLRLCRVGAEPRWDG